MSQYCRIGRKRLRVQGIELEATSLDNSDCDGQCDLDPVIGHPAENCTRCGKQT